MYSNSSATRLAPGSDASADTTVQHSFLVQSLLPVRVNEDVPHAAITEDQAKTIRGKVERRVPSCFPEDFPDKPSDQPFALPSCGGTGLFTRRRTTAGDTLDHREVRWPDGCVIGSYQVEEWSVDAYGSRDCEIVDIDYAIDPKGNGFEKLYGRDRILKVDQMTSVDSQPDPETGPSFDPGSVHVVPTLVDKSHIPYIPRPQGSTTFTTRNNKPFADTSQSCRVRDDTTIQQTHLQRWDGNQLQNIAQYHLAPKNTDTRDPKASAKFAAYEVPADYDGDILWTTGFT